MQLVSIIRYMQVGMCVQRSLKNQSVHLQTCADPECFVRGGPTLTGFFDEGREGPNTTISGPSPAQQNAI